MPVELRGFQKFDRREDLGPPIPLITRLFPPPAKARGPGSAPRNIPEVLPDLIRAEILSQAIDIAHLAFDLPPCCLPYRTPFPHSSFLTDQT